MGAVPEAVRAVAGEGPGDILVFLPGERDIREAARALRGDRGLEVLPLYARLNHAQQERIFRPGERRRVVLATNVAETSITVPGIRFVVDTGLARISRYSHRTRVQRLPVEPVSRASADQRGGRCGRVGPGVCVRLYSREDFESRARFTPPEIRRTNLASVILRMAASGLGRPDEFPFIDPPDRRFVTDGLRLLRELGAFDADDRVTRLGRRLARLPVDPRIGRMILAAGEFDCVAEILVIAAALSAGDPRESTEGGREAAAVAHRRFTDPRSDFMGYLNLWRFLNDEGRRLRSSAWRRRCEELRLSPRRTREWMDVYRQLLIAAREIGLRPGSRPATYAQVHRAVLAGNVAHVGVRSQGREYRGPRDRTFVLSAASAVKPSGVHWIVAAELVETTAVYAHVAARIRPQWVERAARELVTREYFEPRFDPERGEVMALERVVLFGLTLVPRRRVRFAPVDPVAARDIFITEGLTAGALGRRCPLREPQPGHAGIRARGRTPGAAGGPPGRRRHEGPLLRRPPAPGRRKRAELPALARIARGPGAPLLHPRRPGPAGRPPSGRGGLSGRDRGLRGPGGARLPLRAGRAGRRDHGPDRARRPRCARVRALRVARARPPRGEGGRAPQDPAPRASPAIVPLRDTARRYLAWPDLPGGGIASALAAALREVSGVEVKPPSSAPISCLRTFRCDSRSSAGTGRCSGAAATLTT